MDYMFQLFFNLLFVSSLQHFIHGSPSYSYIRFNFASLHSWNVMRVCTCAREKRREWVACLCVVL